VVRVQADPGPAAAPDPLLARRVAQGCVIVAASLLFFALLDPVLAPALLHRLYPLKAANLAVVGLAWVVLRYARSDAGAVAAGLLAFAAACFGLAVSEIAINPSGNTLPLCIALVVGASTFLPWGARAQAVAAAIAIVSGAAVALAMRGSLMASPDFPLFSLVVAASASVWLAREAERQRRELLRENEERRRAEKRLAESVAELEDLWNNTPCGYHSVDANGVFLRINDTELAWTGYTREEVVGKLSVVDVLTPESRKVFAVNFPLLKERGWVRDVEIELLCKDGSILPLLLSSSAVVDEEGRFIASRTTSIDNTARKQFERQKADFFATVAHDIRNPLSTMLGGLEILSEQPGLEAEAREIVAVVARSGKLLSTLVNDYLDYAKIEAGAIRLDPRALPLEPVLRRLCGDIRYEAERRRVTVEVALAGDVGEVCADGMALQRIVSNLLGNALKFTPAEGCIRVGAERRGDEVVVSVTDTGPGISPDEMAQLFVQYRQTETGRRVVGTGLGLYVVKSLAEAMRGRVEVESAVGRGTTFRVRLPAAPARSQAA